MKITVLSAALAALVVAGAARADEPVHYAVTPVLEGGDLTALAVEMRFAGDGDGETRLVLPDEWGGKRELYRHLDSLSVEGAQAREDGAAARILTHAPGAAITVRYRVRNGYDGDPKVGDTEGNPYRPIVRPQWFSAIGQGVFASPGGDSRRAATFEWGTLPAGWKAASDLDHLVTRGVGTVYDVQQSVLIGGAELATYERQVAGAPLRFAVLGDWTFDADGFGGLAAQVIEAQRAYWRSPGEPYFIAVTPLVPQNNWISVGGTGLDDGFSIYGGTDTPLEPLRYLLAHEHLHTWTPARLGDMPQGAEQPAVYWFSEGMTDFLTHRTLLRSGVWSLEEFTARVNEELLAYWTSPFRDEPNSVVAEKFWSDAQAQKIPYRRGMALALLWDWRLKQATNGRRDLDDVFTSQMKREQEIRARGEAPMAHTLFPVVYRELGGGELANDLERFVERGGAVMLPESLFGDCARIETVRRPAFHRGWDAEATTAADNVVTGLRDDSPAYAAGLRNGMQIVRREFGEVGNSTVEYGLRITENGQERIIRFMPVAPGEQVFQRIVLTEGMSPARQATCAKRMSGS